jgi:outer membrane receptor protein involved in Fe transport
VYYNRQNAPSKFYMPVSDGYNAAFGTPFGDQDFFVGGSTSLQIEKALFGEINFDITQQLQATFGDRFFRESIDTTSDISGVFNGGRSVTVGNSSASGSTPKFGLSYHATPDVLTYATAAKGFRQGGPVTGIPAGLCAADLQNLGLNGPPSSFSPDSVWSYELGLKTAWPEHRLIVNAAVYYIDWKNVQQQVVLPTCGFIFTGNFGKARSKGSELEVTYEPVPSLKLFLGAAYNLAQLTATGPGAQGQPGDTLENAPKWQGSVSAEFHRPVSENAEGFARFDVMGVGRQFNNFDQQSNYYARAGYGLTNVRLGVNRKPWQAALYCTNLFDKRAETAVAVSYAVDLPTTRRVALNRPRTIGVDVRFDY